MQAHCSHQTSQVREDGSVWGEDEEGRMSNPGWWWWGGGGEGGAGPQLLERNMLTRSFPQGRSDTWREERDVCSGSALRP